MNDGIATGDSMASGALRPAPGSGLPTILVYETTAIGRDELQTDRKRIDSPHFTVTFSAGQHIIADNSSQYGTWLNEERLTAARPLKHGDVIKLARDVRREERAGEELGRRRPRRRRRAEEVVRERE